jgi:coenzyme F420 hydrogenase subunit beta
MAPEKLFKVIEDNLCARCGACVGICPHKCLFLDENDFPSQKYPCPKECNFCLRVCPGLEVNFPKLTHQIFKKRFDVLNPVGIFQNVLVGHATNSEIREKATSGGVITQLLIYLLEKEEIKGAIVTISDPKKPWKAKPTLAMNTDQIIESSQSKYVISPVNQVLSQLRKTDGKFALVGLPCHVHAIRKLMGINPNLAKKISPILGLYCSMTLEADASIDLAELSDISSCDIQKVEFRSGKWPGFIGVKIKDGTFKKLHKGHIKNIYPILQRLYYPKRCMFCIDGSNEFADISVADPWIRNKKGNYLYPNGSSLMILRTDVGKRILDMAQKDDAIFLEEIVSESFADFNLLMMKKKRKMAFYRMERSKGKKILVPNYNTTLKMTSRERFNETLGSLPFFFGKTNFTRKLALRVALSSLGSLVWKVSDIFKLKKSR